MASSVILWADVLFHLGLLANLAFWSWRFFHIGLKDPPEILEGIMWWCQIIVLPGCAFVYFLLIGISHRPLPGYELPATSVPAYTTLYITRDALALLHYSISFGIGLWVLQEHVCKVVYHNRWTDTWTTAIIFSTLRLFLCMSWLFLVGFASFVVFQEPKSDQPSPKLPKICRELEHCEGPTPWSTTRPNINLSLESLKESVKIILGPDKIELSFPKPLLVFHSDFFARACSERWECGRTATIVLEDEDSDIISIFLTWILTGDVDNATEMETVKTSDMSTEQGTDKFLSQSKRRLVQLCQCFYMADILQAIVFQNCVIDNILALQSTYYLTFKLLLGPDDDILTDVWENTLPKSPLPRIFVDLTLTTHSGRIADLLSNHDGPENLKLEFARECLELAVDTPQPYHYPWSKDFFVYHKHPGKPDNYSCRQGTQGPRTKDLGAVVESNSN